MRDAPESLGPSKRSVKVTAPAADPMLAGEGGWAPRSPRRAARPELDPGSRLPGRHVGGRGGGEGLALPGASLGRAGTRQGGWWEGPLEPQLLGLGETGAGPGRASRGPGQGQLSRTVCPWRGQGGCHSEHAVCQSLGQGRSACWLHPEPAPRDAGGGSQDQSRRLRAPLPRQQGTKVGQGGRRGPRRAGGGARGAQKAPRGRGPGEDAWKSKTMCAEGLGGQG